MADKTTTVAVAIALGGVAAALLLWPRPSDGEPPPIYPRPAIRELQVAYRR